MTRLMMSVAALLLCVGISASQDTDPITIKLNKAKAAYEKESVLVRDGILDWFGKREQVARTAGDKKGVDTVKAERETFDATAELPKNAPFNLRMRDISARKAMLTAFNDAVKEYTKAKKDVAAAAVEEELTAFEKASEPVIPNGKQPAVGVFPVGFNPCARPTERFSAQHQQQLDQAKLAGAVEVVLVGGAHVREVQVGAGKGAWTEKFAKHKAFNVGINGDRTENILWRLTEGKALADLNPKVFVVQAGMENLSADPQKGPTAEQIAGGVKAIVTELRKQKPTAKVLVVGLTPLGFKIPEDVGEVVPSQYLTPKVKAANAMLARLDNRTTIRYVDVASKILDKSGGVPKVMMPNANYSRLTSEAYRAWVEAMSGPLTDLLKE